MSNTYWQDRQANSLNKLSRKSQKAIDAQMRKYYKKAMENTINSFSETYIKILDTLEAGKNPTPADLYKLDTYWKMQGQLKIELEKLGAKQIKALSQAFEANFFDVYYSIALQGVEAFDTVDTAIVQQMINGIWCADGKSWSQRVWDNTSKLAETLNDELVNCVATGKKPSELKKILQERFSVSFNQADTLVRTELAHIQVQAAQKRFEDYGIEKVRVWASKDERQCEVCGKLHNTIHFVSEPLPIPAHPKCRCSVIAVVD